MSLRQRIDQVATDLAERGIKAERVELTPDDWRILHGEIGGRGLWGTPFVPLGTGMVHVVLTSIGPIHLYPAIEDYSALCWPDRPPARLVVHGWNRERIR